jgi:uncharacterized protein (DUF2147 family)
MKRLGSLALLMMLLSSSAYAGTYSFTYHGHRIRVERPRHCFSTSCLSVSVPGLRGTQHEDGVDEAAAASDAPTAKSPAAAPALSPTPLSATSPAPAAAPVQAKPAPSPPVAVAAQTSTSPAVPPRAASKVLPVEKRPPVEKLTVERPVEKPAEKPLEKPAVTAQAAPDAIPPTANASQQASGEQADTPLGDWQTESNKGLVRIEPCGSALCGYTVDAATNAKGETVLINMKPKGTSDKGASDWTGTIVSRASGNTYYAKMAIRQSNTLRVEACAVGRFFCSGNDWSRIVTTPQALITSRGIAAQPRS